MAELAASKSGFGKVTDAVKAAVQNTVTVTNDYVVAPVGEALGLIATEQGPTSKSERKAARKVAVAKAMRSRPVARRAGR
jgi:hypothetical protein